MEIRIPITVEHWHNEYDIEEEIEYVYVDVPLEEIAGIIAKRYDISTETMLHIICDYDLDLDDDIEYNEEIQELGREYYYKKLSEE